MLKWYEERKAQGRCIRCRKITDAGTLCSRCSKLNIDAERERRDRYKKEGRCMLCGRPRGKRGKSRCDECVEARRLRYHEKKKGGICRNCKNPTNRPGGTFCSSCLSTQKRRRGERLALGVCLECAAARLPDNARCEIHYLRSVAKRTLGDRALAEGIKAILLAQDFICPFTGRKLTLGLDAALDHKLPKVRGGADAVENVQWIYAPINEMKSYRTDEEFLELVAEVYKQRFKA
jgi:hypothetical protein